MRILLERDRADPDSKDKNGLTPVLWSIKNGHAKVVLLNRVLLLMLRVLPLRM